MKTRLSLPFIGFLQATGLTVYVSFVVFLMQSMSTRGAPTNPMFQGISILLLFVLSAMVSASIMLGYPAWLYGGSKTKQALAIVGWSIGWLLVYLIVFLCYALFV
jgi:hypothetical protein